MDFEQMRYSEADRELMNRAAKSPLYSQNPVPEDLCSQFSDNLLDFVNIPPTCRSSLFSIYPRGVDVLAVLQEDWHYARELNALRLYDSVNNKVSFPLRMAGPNGRAIDVTIAPSTQDIARKPWYLSYVPSLEFVKTASEVLEAERICKSNISVGSGTLPPQLSEALDAVVERDDYRQNVVSDETLADIEGLYGALEQMVHFPSRWLEELNEIAGYPIDGKKLLERDFKYAYDKKLFRRYEQKILFPISLLRADGVSAVEVSLKRNERVDIAEVRPWVLWGVDSQPRRVIAPGRALERWAYMGNWHETLEVLAKYALPEAWDFEEEGLIENKYSILYNYLCYTFYRLQTEGKVLENAEQGIAAFNTGLVNRTYEPIFACFSSNNGPQPWRFEAFCKQGSRKWGKRLVATFNPLPARAQYFNDKDDLLYDNERSLVLDRDHILLDNIQRLPLEFLEEEFRGNEEALAYLEQIKQSSDRSYLESLYADLRELVEEDSRLKRRLINRLQDSVELATKRVEWNFRTAIPAFYPTRDSMSLLLPLDLTEDSRSDIALVVELQDSGAYLGQTILTMRMAYNNARLICRPDSDWLNTSVRLAVDVDD